jgi:uncharacterized protein
MSGILTWDEAKRRRNVEKHALDFAALDCVFDGRLAITRRDTRRDYGEARFNRLVCVEGIVINVTFTPRSGKFHLISARPANRQERSVYRAREEALKALD